MDMKVSNANIMEMLTKSFTEEERNRLSTRENVTESITRIRKDEATLTADEKQKYINAVRTLLASGQYNELVNIHGNMDHDMHGRNMITGEFSPTGIQRFLAWHRVYLLEFENLLQTIDPSITIPYWNWSKNLAFPEWLNELLPTSMVNRMGEAYDVERAIGANGPLPDPNVTRHGMTTHQTFTDFTLFLEGWQPYGAHNQVHMYVGGTMGTMYSPADPVFWMHHAECDRLWHIWQLTHAEEHASLTGQAAIMDPWAYRYKDVADISALDYGYQSIEIG